MKEDQIRGAGIVLLSAFAALTIAGLLWSSQRLGDERQRDNAIDSLESAGTQVGETRQVFVQPGWRLEQIARALDEAGASGERFMELTVSPQMLSRIASDDFMPSSLEGYIPPGLYELPPDLSEDKITLIMLDRFYEEVAPLLLDGLEPGLSLHEAVTLASIVEREVVRYSDAPLVASVYFNRLLQGIRLQADPTVAYAVDGAEISAEDVDSYWVRELRDEDLAFRSAYNTYLHEGLPPGPIGSPSSEAISAVISPAKTDYLYFVGRDSGSIAFARTLEEHESNIERNLAPPGALQRLVERIMEPVEGHVGVVVRLLGSEESAVIDADDLFTSASLYKLPVMAAAFDLRNRDQMAFDERLAIPSDAWGRDREEAKARLGDNPTIAEAVEQMIVISSNAAGETLLDRVGRGRVEEFARSNGMNDTWLTTKRLLTTPSDVGLFFEKLAKGDLVSDDASAEMLDILLRQEIGDRLPANLPDGVAVAHKTGSLNYVRHDAGILYTSLGPVVIVVMTEDVANGNAATAAISKLGELVFEYFESYVPAAAGLVPSDIAGCDVEGGSAAAGPLEGKVIVLDAAHGGDEPGALYEFADGSFLQESDVALDVALRLRDLLVEDGAVVHMTRCTDVNLGLMERAALANSLDADLFISMHLNGSEDQERDGMEVYYFSEADHMLANYLLGSFTVPALWDALSTELPVPNRGAVRKEFDVLLYTSAPSIVTESVYLTNRQEAIALRDDSSNGNSRREQIANGHFEGILNYFAGGSEVLEVSLNHD